MMLIIMIIIINEILFQTVNKLILAGEIAIETDRSVFTIIPIFMSLGILCQLL